MPRQRWRARTPRRKDRGKHGDRILRVAYHCGTLEPLRMLRRDILALLIAIVLTASGAAAQTLQVAPLPRDGQVLVTFKLGQAFTEEVEVAVHSGLTVSFIYKVDLMRSSAVWFDRTIATAVVTAAVRYDNL